MRWRFRVETILNIFPQPEHSFDLVFFAGFEPELKVFTSEVSGEYVWLETKFSSSGFRNRLDFLRVVLEVEADGEGKLSRNGLSEERPKF